MPSFTPEFYQALWSNFLGSLIADLIVGVLLVWLFTLITSLRTRPDADVVATISPSNPPDDTLVGLTFWLRNKGRRKFDKGDLIWNIYIDRDHFVAPKPEPGSPESLNPTYLTVIDVLPVRGRPCSKYSQSTEFVSFPESTQTMLRLRVKKSPINRYNIYYYLMTSYGGFPRSAKHEDGAVWVNTVGRVHIKQTTMQ